MGLFDFILGKGKKVAEPAAPQAHQVSPEELQKLRNAKRAEALVKEVEALELGIEELKVEVDGAQAIVFGKAPTQAAREKAVLAIGNTDIIEKVDDRMEVVAVEAAAVFYTGQERRHPLEDRQVVLRQGDGLSEDLRGQPPDAHRPGQDLSGTGAAHSGRRAEELTRRCGHVAIRHAGGAPNAALRRPPPARSPRGRMVRCAAGRPIAR